MRCKARPQGIICSAVVLTGAFSTISLILAGVIRYRLARLQINTVGDPERVFLDECMRDFEGLSPNDPVYTSKHRECAKELGEDERYRRLPRVRLTVDERVCDQARLCEGRDPGQCADRGVYGDADYKPGRVTECYSLGTEALAKLTVQERGAALDVAEARCTSKGAWENYAQRVRLEYCMRKHMTTGVCINSLRTDCPIDSSCCPVPANVVSENGQPRKTKPDDYACKKSPTVGLFCQHVDDIVPGSNSTLCTATTCSNFAWCRDLVDIPGLCLSDACQDYQRALAYSVVIIVAVAAGLVLDAADLVILFRYPRAILPKLFLNAIGCCAKLLACLLCLAAGVLEFMGTLEEKACFNDVGNRMVKTTRQSVAAFLLFTSLAVVGSLCLLPCSARWLTEPRKLPYARITPHRTSAAASA